MTGALLERVAATAVGAIALATFSTSAVALTTLAIESGGTAPWLAPMLPVALDGMIVAASMAVVAARRAARSAGYSWCLVALYTATSVAGNALHAAPRGPVAAAIAAAFPLTLLLSFEQLLRITATHRRPSPTTTEAPSGAYDEDTAPVTARARIERIWTTHSAAGADPAALSGPAVADQAGCSVRRAQEILAQLRADSASTATARNGHVEVAP